MRLDSDIKRDVEDELRSDPDIDATNIAVAVKDGVVTLTGFVRSFRQRRKAEQDVKHVAGVVGVASNIEVRLPIIHRRPDPDIARDAVEAIKRELPYSWEEIKVVVEDGLIILEGEVEWHYQRERAEEAVQNLRGATGVVNMIEVRPRVAPVRSDARSRRLCGEPPRSTRVASRSRQMAARSSCGAQFGHGRSASRPNGRRGARPV
jgi:osmotically-inducible protein OsmY